MNYALLYSSFDNVVNRQIFAERNGDVLLAVAHLYHHGYQDTGCIGLCCLDDVHIGDTIDDGLTTLLFVIAHLAVAEVCTYQTNLFFNFLLVNLRTGQNHLRVRQ